MATTPLPGPADAWTATQIRWETMSFINNQSGTYLAPQFVTDGVPASRYVHAVESLTKEGYLTKAASFNQALTPRKGVKLSTEWASKGLVIDRS